MSNRGFYCFFRLAVVCLTAMFIINSALPGNCTSKGFELNVSEDIPVHSAVFDKFTIEGFKIPPKIGTVEDCWNAYAEFINKPGLDNSKNDVDSIKTVILIQDAHCNYDAQHAISKILKYLTGKYGRQVVNLEGGLGTYDLSLFSMIKNTTKRERICDAFVKKGVVNGAEYFSVTNPDKTILWGVDNKKLYLDSLRVFREVLNSKDEIEKGLCSINHNISRLKAALLSEELLFMDRIKDQYKKGELGVKDFFRLLSDKAGVEGVDIGRFHNLQIFAEMLSREKIINFDAAMQERSTMIKRIRDLASNNELKELTENASLLGSAYISEREFYGYFVSLCRSFNFSEEEFVNLKEYADYLKKREKLNMGLLPFGLNGLAEEIKERLCVNRKQKLLNELSGGFDRISNMLEFKMSGIDYGSFKDETVFLRIENAINSLKNEVSDGKIISSIEREVRQLKYFIDKCMTFYHNSNLRDETFIESLRYRESLNGKVAVMVTGGFHSSNLYELMRKNKISYVSIIPAYTNDQGYKSPYYGLMSGNFAGFNASIPGSGVNTLQFASMLSRLGTAVWGANVINDMQRAVLINLLRGNTSGVKRVIDLKITESLAGKKFFLYHEDGTVTVMNNTRLSYLLNGENAIEDEVSLAGVRWFVEKFKTLDGERVAGLTGIRQAVIPFPDIHSSLPAAREFLFSHGLIIKGGADDGLEDELTELGKNTILVQMGDVIDRGTAAEGFQCLVYLKHLKKKYSEARKNGARGDLLRILGNHELIYLLKAFDAQKRRSTVYNRFMSGGLARDLFFSESNFELFVKSLSEDIESGELKAAEVIGGVIFVHAGITPDIAEMQEFKGLAPKAFVEKVNEILKMALRNKDFSHPIFGFRVAPEKLDSRGVDQKILDAMGFSNKLELVNYLDKDGIFTASFNSRFSEMDMTGYRQVVAHDTSYYLNSYSKSGETRLGVSNRGNVMCVDCALNEQCGGGRAGLVFREGEVYHTKPLSEWFNEQLYKNDVKFNVSGRQVLSVFMISDMLNFYLKDGTLIQMPVKNLIAKKTLGEFLYEKGLSDVFREPGMDAECIADLLLGMLSNEPERDNSEAFSFLQWYIATDNAMEIETVFMQFPGIKEKWIELITALRIRQMKLYEGYDEEAAGAEPEGIKDMVIQEIAEAGVINYLYALIDYEYEIFNSSQDSLGMDNIGKVKDAAGNMVESGFSAKRVNNVVIFSNSRAGVSLAIPVATHVGKQGEIQSKGLAEKLKAFLNTISEKLTKEERQNLQHLLKNVKSVEKIIVLKSSAFKIKGYFEGSGTGGFLKGKFYGNTLYLSEEIIKHPTAFLHEMGEGFLKIPKKHRGKLKKHTAMRGAGTDVRIAYGAVSSDNGEDELYMRTLEPEELIRMLEDKMKEKNFHISMTRDRKNPLTESEKELIRYNYNADQDRRGRILLFGLQDLIDPAENARFTENIRYLMDDLRKEVLNIFILPRTQIPDFESAQEECAHKTRRKIEGGYRNTTHIFHFTDSELYKTLEAAFIVSEENKKLLPKIFVECLTAEQAGVVRKFIKEQKTQTPDIHNRIIIANEETKKGAIAVIDEVKTIVVGSVLMNDRRLKNDYSFDSDKLFGIRMRMLDFLKSNKIISGAEITAKFRKSIEQMDSGEIDRVIEEICSGKINLRITRINWQSFKIWKISQEMVLKSL